jgi:hypothetical protein
MGHVAEKDEVLVRLIGGIRKNVKVIAISAKWYAAISQEVVHLVQDQLREQACGRTANRKPYRGPSRKVV